MAWTTDAYKTSQERCVKGRAIGLNRVFPPLTPFKPYALRTDWRYYLQSRKRNDPILVRYPVSPASRKSPTYQKLQSSLGSMAVVV